MERIYLDHAATTPISERVRDAMQPWLGDDFGNPSSLHAEGRRARSAIDEARETLSEELGCLFAETLFTSSGTEAANLAILGTALANRDGARKRVLLSAVEHPCVLSTRGLLEDFGFRVEPIPVDRFARVSLDALQALLADDVLLVSVMHANNELGTVQPVRDIAGMCRDVGALLHSDAVQTFLSMPWKVSDMGADLVSVSAHKAYGPKGAGALYVRAGVKPRPLAVGGGQERELRAGTENVAAIVGFAEAVKEARTKTALPEAARRARDAFWDHLADSKFPKPTFTVEDRSMVLGGHAHLRFEDLSAESMLIVLDRMGVSASSGAACSSGSLEPSHVLLACGFNALAAREGLRFTFGRDSTPEMALEAAMRVLRAAEQVSQAKGGSTHARAEAATPRAAKV